MFADIALARSLLASTPEVSERLIGGAQELIGHSGNISADELSYYNSVRRICCPWVSQPASNWPVYSPLREPEAFMDNRNVVEDVLGHAQPIALAFGISAITSLAEAEFLRRHVDPHECSAEFDPEMVEICDGVAGATAAISLGRQVRSLSNRTETSADRLAEARKRLSLILLASFVGLADESRSGQTSFGGPTAV